MWSGTTRFLRRICGPRGQPSMAAAFRQTFGMVRWYWAGIPQLSKRSGPLPYIMCGGGLVMLGKNQYGNLGILLFFWQRSFF